MLYTTNLKCHTSNCGTARISFPLIFYAIHMCSCLNGSGEDYNYWFIFSRLNLMELQRLSLLHYHFKVKVITSSRVLFDINICPVSLSALWKLSERSNYDC